MAFEYFKDRPKESKRREHGHRGDIDNGNAALERDGLDHVARRKRRGDDQGAFTRRVMSVVDVHWYSSLDRRQHSARMKDLCAKVRELGCLGEGDHSNPP